MFSTLFGEIPVSYYNYKDYNKSVNEIIADTLKLTGEIDKRHLTSYTLKEKDNAIIFKCLAPSISKEQIDISIKEKLFHIKTKDIKEELDFFAPLDFSIRLSKEVNVGDSFAELCNGVLTVNMPIKELSQEKKISFK